MEQIRKRGPFNLACLIPKHKILSFQEEKESCSYEGFRCLNFSDHSANNLKASARCSAACWASKRLSLWLAPE